MIKRFLSIIVSIMMIMILVVSALPILATSAQLSYEEKLALYYAYLDENGVPRELSFQDATDEQFEIIIYGYRYILGFSEEVIQGHINEREMARQQAQSQQSKLEAYIRESYNIEAASPWAQDAIVDATSWLWRVHNDVDYKDNYKESITKVEFALLIKTWAEYELGIFLNDRLKSDPSNPEDNLAISIVYDLRSMWTVSNILSDLEGKNITIHDPDLQNIMIEIIAKHNITGTQMIHLVDAEICGLISPNNLKDPITREQAATIIIRATRLVELLNEYNGCLFTDTVDIYKIVQAATSNAPTATFKDMNLVSTDAISGVNFVYANGIMNGTDDGFFLPLEIVTAEQAIVMINNIDNKEPTHIPLIGSIGRASAWAQEGIKSALKKGFVPAEIQGSYTSIITRQEFCRMAVKWVEYATNKDIDTILSEKGLTRDSGVFTDTSDPDILAAYALGITDGTGNNQFSPNGQFSRQQAATMLMRTCRAIGTDVSNPPVSDFADLNTSANWARDGINFVRANGIMQGTGKDRFSPHATFTREQSILTFNNIDVSTLPGR